MENKMAAKPMCKCGICDNVYDSIEKRSSCEQACLRKQVEEAKKEEEKRKVKEREVRYVEVCDAINKANKLQNEYLKDYGYFAYNSTGDFVCGSDIVDISRKFWNMLP